MDSDREHLLPPGEEPKLIDRPAEERLRAQTGGPDEAERHPHHPSKRTVRLTLLGLAVLLVLLLAVGYIPHLRRERAAAAEARTERESLPIVNAVKVKRSPKITKLMLPGTIMPVDEAFVYARAAGYVSKRFVDIGDHVHKGQVMARIEAPDLDHQVEQAHAAVHQAEQQLGQTKAALEQAEAQLNLARVTWDRYRVLVSRGAVARQDADTQEANYQTATANVHAAEANVRAAAQNVEAQQANLGRLISLQDFENVRSPIDGVVTARNIDVGSLISSNGAGLGSSSVTPPSGAPGATGTSSAPSSGGSSAPTGGGGAGEMYRVARIDRLRILINVPESDAPNIHPGGGADVIPQAFPNATFDGRVTRTASSLDPATRTMLTEVQVENRERRLLPGMFVQVDLKDTRATPPLIIPSDALISSNAGLRVAVLVDPNKEDEQQLNANKDQETERQKSPPKRVHLQPVQPGRDYGTEIEITSGLQGWEYVIVNPSDAAHEGALVEVAAGSEKAAAQPLGGANRNGSSATSSSQADRPNGGMNTPSGQQGQGRQSKQGGANSQKP